MTAEDADIKIKILLAAKKLFAQQGFEKTTIRQICEVAGANVALVSYHFGGKENMFGALFEHFFPNNQIAEIDPSLTPVEGVKLIISEVITFRNHDEELISIIQQEIMINTPRIRKIQDHVMPIWQKLREWLEQGRDQGLFHFRSLDGTLMSVIRLMLFHRNSAYWDVLIEEEETSLDLMVDDLTQFVLNALQYNKK
ncbi:AcrR family transcriptional regulator [Paenibacillus castaneae]|uniref:TetR/AcrR family transcriptional regulator n=1 Tax=Paenibacillus castaneae TaxID=474957 RepID=UPI000C9A146C|nr:TetR family transcriptional regulator [Paenibacillus castaneae]NIK78680.1 AcrR family transcriptional regulator [Paenibacillus castaneae]